MIPVLLALALTTLCGAALARLTRSPLPLAFLYGSGVVLTLMFLLPWRAFPIGGALLALSASFFFVRGGSRIDRHSFSPIDAATILVLCVFGFFAAVAPLWEWDAWAIWALKARVFLEHRGIDWAFLQAETNSFAHPSYPLLLPANLALPAVLSGEWSDRWLGLYSVAFVGAAAVAVRFTTAATRLRHHSATLALAAAGLTASAYVGTAETPLIAFSVCGLILLRDGNLVPAAILLGLAANTKAEGLTLLIASAVGLVAAGRARDVLRLWPAVAIAFPWMALQSIHGLENRIVAGATASAIVDRFSDILSAFATLVRHTDLPLLSIAVLLTLPFVFRKERLLFVTAGVQLAVFLAAYSVTPFDLEWHIATSWERLSRQLLAIAVPATLLGLESIFRSQRETPRVTSRRTAEEGHSPARPGFDELSSGENQ